MHQQALQLLSTHPSPLLWVCPPVLSQLWHGADVLPSCWEQSCMSSSWEKPCGGLSLLGPGLSYAADIPVLPCPAMNVPAPNPDPQTWLPSFAWDLPHHLVCVGPAVCPWLLLLLPALPIALGTVGLCTVSLPVSLPLSAPGSPALAHQPPPAAPSYPPYWTAGLSFYCVSFLGYLKEKTLLFIYMGFCSSTRKKWSMNKNIAQLLDSVIQLNHTHANTCLAQVSS